MRSNLRQLVVARPGRELALARATNSAVSPTACRGATHHHHHGSGGWRTASSSSSSASLVLQKQQQRARRSQSPVLRGVRTTAATNRWGISKNEWEQRQHPPSGSSSSTSSRVVLRNSKKYRWLSTMLSTEDAATSSKPNATTTTPSDSTSGCSFSMSIDELLVDSGIDRAYLEHLASQHPTPLRLQDMYHLGRSPDGSSQRLRNAQFLHQELPIRMAQRAMDLLTLPRGLSAAAPIRQVASIYLRFLQKFRDFPKPTTVEEEQAFTDMVQAMVLDRTSIPISIAQGVQSWWKQAAGATNSTNSNDNDDVDDNDDKNNNEKEEERRLQEMEEALYRFFTARVGVRFLIEHYVLSSNRPSATALRQVTSMFPASSSSSSESFVPTAAADHHTGSEERGLIQANVCVVQEIRRVADLVTHQTREFYGPGLCPIIDIVDCVNPSDNDDNSSNNGETMGFTYVPQHLHYMMTELLKNSCRASVRRYRELQRQAEDNNQDPTSIEIPRIRVVIVKGDEDVTIKVADKGGGIPRSLLPTIWKFAHSTASPNEQKSEFGTDVTGARIRGFGLPLARIYARYFGGELTLKSTEGYGLDAYLHLPRLGDACEKLPLRVRDSPGERDSMPMAMMSANNNSSSNSAAAANSSSSSKKKTKSAGRVQRQRTYSTTATYLIANATTSNQTTPSLADSRNALAAVRNNSNAVAALGL